MHIQPSTNARLVFRPLPLGSIQMQDGFWKERQETNRRTTLRSAYKTLDETGHFDNFRMAAGTRQGEYHGSYFNDSDVFKWLEALSLEMANQPDPELDAMADEVITLLAAAQMPDGYLNAYIQVTGKPRLTNLARLHELYCAGHMFEAAVAHHRATGKHNFLDVALRYADFLDSYFGPGKHEGACGHPEIELALVELFRETGEPRYRELALFFIDQRGKNQMRGYEMFGTEYCQDRLPVRESFTVEGHAVRQLYLNAGVADLYLETGETALLEAMQRQWVDMTTTKMYISGGIGSRYYDEAFGDSYELPSRTAYAETCAAIASMMWNWRMLAATGESKYADLMERILYNGFLSGWSLDGYEYFYVNPLESMGGIKRHAWFDCACCPPNIMRQIAAVQYYMATIRSDGLQLHQYMNATIQTESTKLEVHSGFPWDGKTTIKILTNGTGEWDLSLRIPGWCQDPALRVNGEATGNPQPGNYVVVRRAWKAGDMVELDLPMRPHFVQPHPNVNDLRGCAALECGPLVYCFEEIDQPAGVSLADVQVALNSELKIERRTDLLGGIHMVHARGLHTDTGRWNGQLYLPAGQDDPLLKEFDLKAVPYFTWANRGAGAMRVWMARK